MTAADRLLMLVNVDPRSAEVDARHALVANNPAAESEFAKLHWVIGLALREAGRLDEARAELETARTSATESGHSELGARISSSLAFLVGQQGDLDRAMSLLRDAEPELRGAELAKATGQLGIFLYWRGELTEAASRLQASCDELAGLGDHVYATRYRSNLGAVLSLLGDYDGAERQLREAVAMAQKLELNVDAGIAAANLGYASALRGDLPSALDEFERAEVHYHRGNAASFLPRLHADHAQALADAGLFADADALVKSATSMYRNQGQETELAGALLTSAEIRLAQNDLAGAIEAAVDAGERFMSQGRGSWSAIARGLELQARARGAADGVDLAEQLVTISVELAGYGLSSESTRCRLVAARLFAGAPGGYRVELELRRAVEQGRAADRILLAHVDAISALSVNVRTSARRAVTRGLKTAMSAQAALGSIETRAHAAVHGFALTELGARLAIEDGRPRELLERIEATRLMTSRMPALRPPDDPEMAAMLTELRRLEGTIADSATSDDDRDHAEHERTRLERDVRRRSRAVRGDSSAPVGVREELGSALSIIGDRQLLAHAALDGQLYAVSVVDRRARLHDLGPIEGVSEMLDEVAFSLNRLNRVQGSEASRMAAAEMLFEVAVELSELLLPDVIVESMAPIVVVPTAVLHDVPWGLLPALGGRAVSINPSVSAWARAHRTREERHASRTGLRSVGFMAGPGLEFAEFEVEHLAVEYSDPEVITGPDATGAACVDLLGRADLVHIACHGSFRTDNPMFSSLVLADGPLIVHDLERLERLPETVVLPACSVATAKALQGGSLLGLATALITLGACNVIAPLTPINDASSVTVMQRLHRELVRGATPAAALASAAMSHDLTDPTAASFITLGA